MTPNNTGFQCRRKDCFFRNRRYAADYACDYSTITGRTRTRRDKPADPANCEYYFKKPRMPRSRGNSLTGPVWETAATGLRAAGYSVMAIARVLGQEPESVKAFIKLTEMPKDMRPKYTFSRFDWGKAEELYRAGKTDAAIAKALGCSPSTVLQWRAAFKLPTNNPKGKKVG